MSKSKSRFDRKVDISDREQIKVHAERKEVGNRGERKGAQ